MRFKLIVAVALLASSPATAQISLVERQQGAQFRTQILQQFGGAYTGPGNALVQRVGRRMAIASGISRDGSDCTVTLLNSTIVNAFATPGCFIYTTRGLLAIVQDEAELASVLGHEIGHVAAHHARARQNRSTIAGLGALAASVLTGSQTVGRLASGLGQRYVLGFSRDQEYEADGLGVRYMTQAGYAPFESPAMLQALADNDALQARLNGVDPQAKIPSWARSHPLTSDRIARAATLARQTGLQPGEGRVATNEYLAGIDGLLWGDDPEQGYIDGPVFAHPKIRISFRAPPGFMLQNSPAAVQIVGESGKAQFGGGGIAPGEDIAGYAARVARAIVGQTPVQSGAPQRLSINGFDAVVLPMRAQANSGAVDVTVAAYQGGPGVAYQFIIIAPAGKAAEFDPLLNSLRRLSPAEAAALRSRMIRVVTVAKGDTIASIAGAMAFTDGRIDRFRALNEIAPGQAIQVGEHLKTIVYAPQ